MQTGPRAAIVRVLAALAVIAFVGAGALLAIGPNRTADWSASDCGAPIRWLTDDHPYDSVIVPFSDAPKPWSVATAAADCRSAVWHQIHRAAALGARASVSSSPRCWSPAHADRPVCGRRSSRAERVQAVGEEAGTEGASSGPLSRSGPRGGVVGVLAARAVAHGRDHVRRDEVASSAARGRAGA